MRRTLTKEQATEICKHLKIINMPIQFIVSNSNRFLRLYDITRFELSTDFDSAYRRDKINFCYDSNASWEAGR